MNFKEVEKLAVALQAQLFKNSNSMSAGLLKSHLRGAGIHFKEHQVYVPGDDVRFIDWKLLAKSSHPFVKTFEEDRNVEITVFIDFTESLLTGYFEKSKIGVAVEIACLLFLLSKKNQDRVSLVLAFNELNILPLRSGKEGMVGMIGMLEKLNFFNKNGELNRDLEEKKETGEKEIFVFLKSQLAKKREVVLLSDFSRYQDTKTLSTILNHKSIHSFRLRAELDDEKTQKFSILTKSKDVKKWFFAKSRNEEKFKGRWTDLDISGRYLDVFIKEFV